jgi:hypothetical protein
VSIFDYVRGWYPWRIKIPSKRLESQRSSAPESALRGPCECSICGHRWVVDIDGDGEWTWEILPLACPERENMTGHLL